MLCSGILFFSFNLYRHTSQLVKCIFKYVDFLPPRPPDQKSNPAKTHIPIRIYVLMFLPLFHFHKFPPLPMKTKTNGLLTSKCMNLRRKLFYSENILISRLFFIRAKRKYYLKKKVSKHNIHPARAHLSDTSL